VDEIKLVDNARVDFWMANILLAEKKKVCRIVAKFLHKVTNKQ